MAVGVTCVVSLLSGTLIDQRSIAGLIRGRVMHSSVQCESMRDYDMWLLFLAVEVVVMLVVSSVCVSGCWSFVFLADTSSARNGHGRDFQSAVHV